MNEEFPYMTERKQDVQTSRKFCKNVPLGMEVYRSMTVNFDIPQIIEHIEIACPKFTLTENGPQLKTKQELAVESEIENL